MKEIPESLSHIPRENFVFDCHMHHGELVDTTTGTGWHSVHPISRETFGTLELPEGFRKGGIATSVTDAYCFLRPPGADREGPLPRREIGGHEFMNIANPPANGPERLGDDGWPMLLRVDKYHTLIYNAGREIGVIRAPDGREFVELIAPVPEGGAILQGDSPPPDMTDLNLPEGWNLRTELTASLTIIHLPCPTEALFFANGASYQGPVDVFKISEAPGE